MLIKHFFPGSNICIMSAPLSAAWRSELHSPAPHPSKELPPGRHCPVLSWGIRWEM